MMELPYIIFAPGYIESHVRLLKDTNNMYILSLLPLENEIDFKVPYFQDIAVLNWGDMLLLGSKAKYGKTTISMNFVKSFVEQGVKPYYISLETGSRFIKTAIKLRLNDISR